MSASVLNLFDAQFALNQFSGNQSLLIKILEKFIQRYQHFDTLLIEYLQKNSFESANQEVHTIKGVSGNLGMQALHQECKKLEENLAHQISEHALNEFLKIFKQTLSLIQNYSAENGVDVNPEVAIKQDDKAVLIAALKRNEFISESKMHNYEQSLNLSSEKLNELKQAIDNLDYISALQILG